MIEDVGELKNVIYFNFGLKKIEDMLEFIKTEKERSYYIYIPNSAKTTIQERI